MLLIGCETFGPGGRRSSRVECSRSHGIATARNTLSKKAVLALFADEAAANAAVESLKSWDELDDDVKLHAIAVMVLDDKGETKEREAGPTLRRREGCGRGPLIVVLFAPLGPFLTLPMVGGIFGAVHRNGVGLHSSAPALARPSSAAAPPSRAGQGEPGVNRC